MYLVTTVYQVNCLILQNIQNQPLIFLLPASDASQL